MSLFYLDVFFRVGLLFETLLSLDFPRVGLDRNAALALFNALPFLFVVGAVDALGLLAELLLLLISLSHLDKRSENSNEDG